MRTTVSLPDELYQSAEPYIGERSFSHFVREAVRHYVTQLERNRLAREMEEGYRIEAESPSLDPIWHTVDGDGL
jgi:metal-responsive CopG/Arc/MetJ family transcriptional regulator